MTDPLSITASALAVITAAVQSTNSLYSAVSRYKGRDKTLGRLQNELQDLGKILEALKQALDVETSMLELLHKPIDRCSKVCRRTFHGVFLAEVEDGYSRLGQNGIHERRYP